MGLLHNPEFIKWLIKICYREFCSLVIDKLLEEKRALDDNKEFENCIKLLCDSLEQQCSSEQSIEKEHIQNAIEVNL